MKKKRQKVKKMRKSAFNDFPASQIKTAINEWVHSERNREILELALIDGWTYQEIADKFYMSETAVVKTVRLNGDLLLLKLNKK